MLNLSPHNSISDKVQTERHSAFAQVAKIRAGVFLARLLLGLSGIFLVIMFLPWTQVVHGSGEITGKNPRQRPQKIPSVIPGEIQEWHVQEGDVVHSGDTIVELSEVKDKYFDPELIKKTETRIQAKEEAFNQYKDKAKNLKGQIAALKETRNLKLQQLRNKIRQARLKVQSDSMDLQAAKTNLEIAENQLERIEKLKDKGLKSLSELQEKQLKYRQAQAKKISAENKLLSSRNELINLELELSRMRNLYRDKISKARSDLNSAQSQMHSTRSDITKLQNELVNYKERSGYRVVTAPQKGMVTKIAQAGIGEIIKQGETIVSIMPDDFKLAVELYVKPRDYPLLYKGETVRLQFDGWPSIVFSGWPNISHGTFEGKIYAIDRFISNNGKFRIMVAPTEGADWPDALRAGSGAKGMIMLENVPVWYEIWRQLNGFPPNFYKPNDKQTNKNEDVNKNKRPKINIK